MTPSQLNTLRHAAQVVMEERQRDADAEAAWIRAYERDPMNSSNEGKAKQQTAMSLRATQARLCELVMEATKL